MPLRVVVLTVLLCLAAAAPAAAVTTVTYNVSTGLLVESTAGESNVVTVRQSSNSRTSQFSVTDSRAGVAAGSGCQVPPPGQNSANEGDTAVCEFSPNLVPSVNTIVRLGAGNDELRVEEATAQDRGNRPYPVTVFAGSGNDAVEVTNVPGVPGATLNGEEGDDRLLGTNAADTLDGGPGNDTLVPGAEADTLRGGDGDDVLDAADPDVRSFRLLVSQPFRDTYEGGAGRDRVDYSARAWYEAVTVDLNTGAGGQTGEGDSFKEIEDITGGRGNDTLIGNDADNSLRGGSGNDTIDGGKGNDDLGADAATGGSSGGEPGADQIKGGDGNDAIRGGDANDVLLGGTGDDMTDGGDGNDELRGEDGADKVVGGLGGDSIDGGRDNDTIDALDAVEDKLSCGSGLSSKGGGADFDSIKLDLKDQNPGDCENLTDGAINEGPYVSMRTARGAVLDTSGALSVTLVCPKKLAIGCVGTLRAGVEPKTGRIATKLGAPVRYRLGPGKRAAVLVKLPASDRLKAKKARTQLVSLEKGSFGDKRRVRTLARVTGR